MISGVQVFSDHLVISGKSYRCAIGRSGRVPAAQKREGDGATPMGVYPVRSVWFRPDRVTLPPVSFPSFPIAPDDGWCDAPDHADYNRHVKRPFNASHENLWREDGRYDVIVVLGHNDAPPVPYMGSCIFFHIAAPDYAPTAGCVAVSLPDMLEILPLLRGNEKIEISDK